MDRTVKNPFDSIESAHDFVSLLAATLAESKRDLEFDLEREVKTNGSRRLDALRLARYNLEKLESHINQSRRILNDLRTLRRLLLQERSVTTKIDAGFERQL